MADYLAGEVFSHISPEDGDVLRRTSISDPIPAGLATELAGRVDAVDVLRTLERSTGLVVASGAHRTEFRIQELMRTYLTGGPLPPRPSSSGATASQGSALVGSPGPTDRSASACRSVGRPDAADDLPAPVGGGARGTWRAHRAAPRRGHRAGRPAPTTPGCRSVSAHIHLGNGDRLAAKADIDRANAGMTDPDDTDLDVFCTATSRLTGLEGPAPDLTAVPDDSALAALAFVGRGATRIFAADGPADTGAVPRDLEAALALARDQHLGLLQVQCLCLIGTAAAVAGDRPARRAAADAAIAAAAENGWHDSPWTAAAHAVLRTAWLGRAAPARALQVSVEGLLIAPTDQDPVVRFALRCARGAARFDTGDRGAGLLELQQAHAELGGTTAPLPIAAWAALLEHRAALLLGFPAAVVTASSRLAPRSGVEGELALMRAWSEAADGSPHGGPGDGGTAARRGRPAEPSVDPRRGVARGGLGRAPAGRPSGRPKALQTALDLAEPMDALRPFALAGHGRARAARRPARRRPGSGRLRLPLPGRPSTGGPPDNSGAERT